MEYNKTVIAILASNESLMLKKTINIIENTCEQGDIEKISIILSQNVTEECKQEARRLSEGDEHQTVIETQQQKTHSIPAAIYNVMHESNATHLLLMCADGETDPYAVANFICEAKTHPGSLISGSRWLKGGGFVGYGKINTVFNYLFQKGFSFLYHTEVSDATFSFFIAPIMLVENLKLGERGFCGYMEFLIRGINSGVDIKQIPVKWVARNEGKSTNSFLKKLKYVPVAIMGRIKK